MTTKILVYNQAALHLGESRYSSLTEARESRYNLDTVYDSVLQYMLEAGFWKFAMRSVEITQDTAITPSFGYAMAFNKPEDWVKTYQLSTSPDIDSYSAMDWIEESNLFFANAGPIYLRYVSNSSSDYGLDLSRWTARFEMATAYQLASRIAGKVTGSSDNLRETLSKAATEALSSALSFEALREPMRRPPQGNWAASRHGGGRPRRVAGGYLL